MFIMFACSERSNSKSDTSSAKTNSTVDELSAIEYLNVITELHDFECDYMTRAGNQKKYSTSYEFRSDVFQEILKDMNRANLSKYEAINYKLADIEHGMSDEQKINASAEMEKIYQKGCNEK